MVSQRAKSEVWAVARGEDCKADLTEDTKKITGLQIPLERQMTGYCDFREGAHSILKVLHKRTNEALTAYNTGTCRL